MGGSVKMHSAVSLVFQSTAAAKLDKGRVRGCAPPSLWGVQFSPRWGKKLAKLNQFGPVHGHRFEVLTADRPGQRAELSRHRLEPGGATGASDDPPMHEPGSRETALVERGSVVLVCDGQRHELGEGDCVTFDADLPHHFESHGDAEAAFLAVVSAGLRRS